MHHRPSAAVSDDIVAPHIMNVQDSGAIDRRPAVSKSRTFRVPIRILIYRTM